MNKKEKIAVLVVFLLYMLYCLDFSEPSPLNQVASEHGRYMKKNHQCRLSGIGSRGPEKLEEIFLTYDCSHEAELVEARKLILDSAQKLLDIVNSNTDIQDSLSVRPYSIKNLHIAILFADPEIGKLYSESSLALVSLLDGTIDYAVDDPDTGFLKDYKFETYSEALSAVKEEE